MGISEYDAAVYALDELRAKLERNDDHKNAIG